MEDPTCHLCLFGIHSHLKVHVYNVHVYTKEHSRNLWNIPQYTTQKYDMTRQYVFFSPCIILEGTFGIHVSRLFLPVFARQLCHLKVLFTTKHVYKWGFSNAVNFKGVLRVCIVCVQQNVIQQIGDISLFSCSLVSSTYKMIYVWFHSSGSLETYM